VAVLGHNAPGVELDYSQRQPVTVNHAAVHAVPDALQIE
jgi:hypothetical protein